MKNIILPFLFVLIHWTYAAAQLPERGTDSAELFNALDNKNEEKFRRLIEYGTNANITDDNSVGDTPMAVASLLGLEDSVKLLLNRGYRHQIYNKDTSGRIPLHNAAQNGHVNVMRILIQNGSKIDEKDKDGFTALHIASLFGRINETDLLIQSGSNVNGKLVDGETPLHLAAREATPAHKDVAALLLDNGADIQAEDSDGRTPRDVAVQSGHLEFADWLYNKQNSNGTLDNESESFINFLQGQGTEDINSQNGTEKSMTPVIIELTTVPMFIESATDLTNSTDYKTENAADLLNGLGTGHMKSQNETKKELIPVTTEAVTTELMTTEPMTTESVTIPNGITDYQNHNPALFGEFMEDDNKTMNETDGIMSTADQTKLFTENPTKIPTAIPTAIPTTIPTKISTTISTAILTAIPTTISTTIAATIPTTILTKSPPKFSPRFAEECQAVCDKQSMDISERQLAIAEDFSWMATLGYLNDTESTIEHRCGGAIISDEFILTAAHCVDEENLPLIVRLGVLSLNGKSSTTYRIKEIIRHEGYSSITKKNDIALIRLMKKVICTPDIRPACLETDLHDLSPSMRLNVTGWGSRSSDEIIRTKDIIKAEVTTLPRPWCNSIYLDYNKNARQVALQDGISESQYCAWESSGRTDTCWGESGGPLQFARYPNTSYIVGIVSFGVECGKWPTIYTRVAYYLDWIATHSKPQQIYSVSASYKVSDQNARF